MSISAAAISHAIHGTTHHGSTHRSAPAGQVQHFSQQLATAQQAGASPQAGQAQRQDAPGALLSADMLQAIQGIR